MGVTFTDVFCGAGGSSIGLVAAGFELRLAANHWDRAIETHSANFPDAGHLCADVSNYDMRRLPRTDVLWASPECTWSSPAGGRRRRRQPDLFGENLPAAAETRSRMTMVDVIRATEVHRYPVVIVENVVAVTAWELWDWWLDGMHRLGYRHQIACVSSAHIWGPDNPPAPQWRDRIHVVYLDTCGGGDHVMAEPVRRTGVSVVWLPKASRVRRDVCPSQVEPEAFRDGGSCRLQRLIEVAASYAFPFVDALHVGVERRGKAADDIAQAHGFRLVTTTREGVHPEIRVYEVVVPCTKRFFPPSSPFVRLLIGPLGEHVEPGSEKGAECPLVRGHALVTTPADVFESGFPAVGERGSDQRGYSTECGAYETDDRSCHGSLVPESLAQLVEQVDDAVCDGLVSVYLAIPTAGFGIRDELAFDAEPFTKSGCVLGCGDELGAAEVEVAFAGAFLGEAEAASELEFGLVAARTANNGATN